MDRLSFDELARLMAIASSRRILGGALIAFLAGLLGVGPADDTLAHNARKRCRKIKNKKKRKKCLKSARRHKRKHQRKRRKNTTPKAECTNDTDCDQPAEVCARAVCESGKCRVGPNSSAVCREEGPCESQVMCNDIDLTCPDADIMQNDTPCNVISGVCCNGSCCQPPNICDDNRCCLQDGSSCGEPGDECCGVCSLEKVCTAG